MCSECSQAGQVQQLYEFRKLTSDLQNFEIPERPENRRTTDKKWLIAFIVVVVVLIPFLIYTLLHTELKQLSGSDNCGNFCGYKNKKNDEWACTGKDYTEQKYHHLTETAVFNGIHVRGKECVAECPNGFEPTFNTCLPKFTNKNNTDNLDDFVALMGEIGRDMGRGWWAILLSAIVSCLLCFGTMSLFRWAVDFVVWFIIIGSIVILAILGGLCWYAYFHFKDDPLDDVGNTKDQGAGGFLILTIFFSIIIAVLIIVITSMVKRVKLIIALFREASKAIFDVPFMILIPVYTSILVTLSFLIFVVLTFFMALAGKLSEVAPNYLEYRLDGVMITALAYNIFGYIWVTQFIIGAQYIIIAGGVSAWFFTRNKHYLDSPLWTSFTNFTHFHLGTVAIGSLVIILMSTLRPLLKSVAKITKTKWISNIEEFIMFLSKKAYIQTALHSQPFFKSGERAAKLLVSSAANVIALNSIGDFVLGIAQLLLMVVSTTVAVYIAKATGLKHYWAIAIICAFVAVYMAATFFAIFEATINCISICFCEDRTLNDGMARPYFMSKGLMQFIEDSNA